MHVYGTPSSPQSIRRRRAVALLVLGLTLVGIVAAVMLLRAPEGTSTTTPPAQPAAVAETGETTTAEAPTTSETTATARRARPSDRGRLRLTKTITGDIAPKSVASNGAGLVTAQNMMYRHSVTVYDSRRMALVATIDDSVRLSDFGVSGHPGVSRGAPVEAAFSPDGRYAYVSNYAMYGAGFGPEGSDTCSPSSGYDDSFVYRIDLERRKIDDVYRVGAVPKVVAATPDGRFVLVSNWCTWDLSVISTKQGREVKRVAIGAYPRGIAVSPNGRAAYVAVMGGSDLIRVDLRNFSKRSVSVGSGPRAVLQSPSGRYLYVTLNAEGRVAKVDLRSGRTVAKVATGSAPRSLAMAPDGRALYVVNYESNTVSKVRTSDMKVLQTIDACTDPIGIAYDAPTRRVWVACYGGALQVYTDR